MKRALATAVLILAGIPAAFGQTPPNLPSNTVWGNLSPVTGPSRAVSLAQIQAAILFGETPVNDANYSALTTDRTIVYTAITAARTVTLPSAASFGPGVRLFIFDRSGSASSTNTISIAPTGADTINGANSSFPLVISAYSGAIVETDGVSKWTAAQSSVTAAQLPPGVDTNTLNAKTANYSLLTSDCGKTVTLGGSAFYTLTVGAASGFPATCSVVIANIDTGRGKTMAINGITFPNNSILWPKQNFTLKNESNVWTIVHPPGRWQLSANVQFEVNASSGNNSNDGLATGANAFQTIAGAASVISAILDARGFGVVLHTDCSGAPTTYTGQTRLSPIVGQTIGNNPSVVLGANSTPVLSGDTTTPSNCILTSSSGSTILVVGGAYWNIQGFQLKNTDGSSPCILADQQSWIRFQFLDFNSCNGASGNHIVSENFSGVEPTGNYTISAGANSHALTTLHGEFIYGSGTITITGTPAWASSFAFSTRNSLQFWGGATFSGASTGPRYNASLGGGIDTNAGGASFLPGNSAGSATNPGWYN